MRIINNESTSTVLLTVKGNKISVELDGETLMTVEKFGIRISHGKGNLPEYDPGEEKILSCGDVTLAPVL